MKNSDSRKEKTEFPITPQGSLGILALGAIGVEKWREIRSKHEQREKDRA